MNLSPSLDEIISQQAVVFADQIKQAATFAAKEEEIRIEAEKALAFIQREAEIKLEGRHEFTIGTGRADSVYDCVIIEYKNPASPDRLSAKSDAAGNKKVIEQLKNRFYDMRTIRRFVVGELTIRTTTQHNVGRGVRWELFHFCSFPL